MNKSESKVESIGHIIVAAAPKLSEKCDSEAVEMVCGRMLCARATGKEATEPTDSLGGCLRNRREKLKRKSVLNCLYCETVSANPSGVLCSASLSTSLNVQL